MSINLNISLDDTTLSRALEEDVTINVTTNVDEADELHLVGDVEVEESECLTDALNRHLDVDVPRFCKEDIVFDVAEFSPQIREKLRAIAERLVNAPVVKNNSNNFKDAREQWGEVIKDMMEDSFRHNPVNITLCTGTVSIFDVIDIDYRVTIDCRLTTTKGRSEFNLDNVVNVVLSNNNTEITTLHYKPDTAEFIDDNLSPHIEVVIDELLKSSFVSDVENKLNELTGAAHVRYSIRSTTDCKNDNNGETKQKPLQLIDIDSLGSIAEKYVFSVNESCRNFNESRNKVKEDSDGKTDCELRYCHSSPFIIARGRIHVEDGLSVFYSFRVEDTEFVRYRAYGERPLVTMTIFIETNTLDVVHYAVEKAEWLDEVNNDVSARVIQELSRSGKLEEVRKRVFDIFPVLGQDKTDTKCEEEEKEVLTLAEMIDVLRKVAAVHNYSRILSSTFDVLSNGRVINLHMNYYRRHNNDHAPDLAMKIAGMIRELYPNKIAPNRDDGKHLFTINIRNGAFVVNPSH